MLDDSLIRTELRVLVDGTEPVTVQPATLRQLRQVFVAVDAQRYLIRTLNDRVDDRDGRIRKLRDRLAARRQEAEKARAALADALVDRDAARAAVDDAVLERDNTLAELQATEEQVRALLRERDRLAAENAELRLQQVQGAA